MSAHQRRKGATGERELVNILNVLVPGYAWMRTAPMQAGGVGYGDVSGHPRLYVECKRGRATPQSALKQAVRDVEASVTADGADRMPLAVTRADGEQWIVTMRLQDFCELIRTWDRLNGR